MECQPPLCKQASNRRHSLHALLMHNYPADRNNPDWLVHGSGPAVAPGFRKWHPKRTDRYPRAHAAGIYSFGYEFTDGQQPVPPAIMTDSEFHLVRGDTM